MLQFVEAITIIIFLEPWLTASRLSGPVSYNRPPVGFSMGNGEVAHTLLDQGSPSTHQR